MKRGGGRLLTKYEILDIIIIDEKPEICSCVTHEAGKHYSKNIPETFENCCLNISDSCIGDALGCLDELENCGYRENEFITREMGENKSTTPEKLIDALVTTQASDSQKTSQSQPAYLRLNFYVVIKTLFINYCFSK